MLRLLFLFLLLFVLSTPALSHAQEEYDDEPPEFLPGLLTEYRSGEHSIQRIELDVQSHFETELLPQALEADGPLEITWRGLLQIRSRGPFTFSAYSNAALELEVDGKVVLRSEQLESSEWTRSDPTEVGFGRRPFRLTLRTDQASKTRLGLFWSAPSYQLEPITEDYFSHEYEETIEDEFGRGRVLARALRCAACHSYPAAESKKELLPAPVLAHLQGNLRSEWLTSHLSETPNGEGADVIARRGGMPYFAMDSTTAMQLQQYLMASSSSGPDLPDPEELLREEIEANRKKPKKQRLPELSEKPADRIQRGADLVASVGCLACHQMQALGTETSLADNPWGGGDLSQVADKRQASFFARWLQSPESVNSNHRMPHLSLSARELVDLSAFLSTCGNGESKPEGSTAEDSAMALGMQAFKGFRCSACHRLDPATQRDLPALRLEKTALNSSSDWTGAGNCLGEPNAESMLPGFALGNPERKALRSFITQGLAPRKDGADLLAEKNCLACHRRGQTVGIAEHLPEIAVAHPNLASRLAGLSPPAISGVGDKLKRPALVNAIQRASDPMRPWLDVRMPKYAFTEAELDSIVDYLVDHDRIPEQAGTTPPNPVAGSVAQHAANRLVTSAGFGCQSCHAIGEMESPQVDLKARGTNLAMLEKRIRPSWFQRWVRNPSRIVPRMEMPSIQVPVKGVLNEDLDQQLHALWYTLNQPDFKPPRPGAVRVVRSHNQLDHEEPTKVVSGVIETSEASFNRPLLFGLPNRHNVLFDQEAGSFAGWWLGDSASQHTRSKTWYWEAGQDLASQAPFLQFRLQDIDENVWVPFTDGRVAFDLDSIEHFSGGIKWKGRLSFAPLSVLQREDPDEPTPIRQVTFEFELTGAPGSNQSVLTAKWEDLRDTKLALQFASELPAGQPLLNIPIAENAWAEFQSDAETTETAGEGSILLSQNAESLKFSLTIRTSLPPESFPVSEVASAAWASKTLDSVPGYEAVQLPLPPFEMPISFAWGEANEPYAGQFFMGSLKGRVFQLVDRDGDGLEDHYQPLTHEIPTPYGLQVGPEGLDVLAKYALLRFRPSGLFDATHSGTWHCRVVADGWGMTADYHDWAVGLEADPEGNYYMTLPCQQDERDEVDARYRGHALKLVRQESELRSFRIESLCAGLRFPMGLVRTQDGQLYATDNQGNYNPFNELNHLQPGKRYGFINRLENKDGFSPPFETPAVNLPHPWTRSVNGVCELRTPTSSNQSNLFGPFEGHLLGCEMNGRSLIRMSLQEVEGQMQGAAYMFSRKSEDSEVTFEGPIVCEVAPTGDVYIGNLHDSGWGGGQNTGSIVRLRPNGNLPLGIREVQAYAEGFHITFTKPVAGTQAMNPANYQIRSYRRIATPAYGGDDQDERKENVEMAILDPDQPGIFLKLDGLRAGVVYEINIADAIAGEGEELFPNQAHYTMRRVPE